ncbi:MAG: RNA polymerase sigma factor [Nannocystales bacterium]
MSRRAKSRAVPEPMRGQFEALYLEHHAFVGRCLRRWGIAPAAVDDARQDVFLTAYRRMHTVEDQASMRAWLAGISRRIASRHRRTRERHDRRVDALATVRPEVVSLEDWVRTREAQAVLDAFVEALDAPKREAFVLCELEGLSAREAAAATGVNQATLYSRLRVARSSFVSMCAALERDGIRVQPEHAAAIHQQSNAPDSRAAMRGWVLLAPKLLSAGASTVLLAKPVFLAALVVGGVGISSAAVLASPGFTGSVPPPAAPVGAPAAAAPKRRVAAAPAPTRPAPPNPKVQVVDEVGDVSPTPPRPSMPSPVQAPLREGDLAAQVALLGLAEGHLGRGAWQEALAASTSYLESWPAGPLAQDAVRVAVRVHCAADDIGAATAFVRAHLPGVDAKAWTERRCKKNDGGVMKSPAGGD